MLELLSKKAASGDICISLARHYLGIHEWGLARKTVEEGMAKGALTDPSQADKLLEEILERLIS